MQIISGTEQVEMGEAIAKYLSAQGVDKQIAESLVSVLQPALVNELGSLRRILEDLDASGRRLAEAVGNDNEAELLLTVSKTLADRPGGEKFYDGFGRRIYSGLSSPPGDDAGRNFFSGHSRIFSQTGS